MSMKPLVQSAKASGREVDIVTYTDGNSPCKARLLFHAPEDARRFVAALDQVAAASAEVDPIEDGITITFTRGDRNAMIVMSDDAMLNVYYAAYGPGGERHAGVFSRCRAIVEMVDWLDGNTSFPTDGLVEGRNPRNKP